DRLPGTGPPSYERPDAWMTDNGRDFYNASEQARLVQEGVLPRPKEENVPAATSKPKPAKAKKSAISGLSKAKLRAYLLDDATIADKAWNAAYGSPEREKGETRGAYIRRVLA